MSLTYQILPLSVMGLTVVGMTAWFLGGPSPLEGAEHTKDSLKEVQEKLDKHQAVLLDVREQDEWDAGHLQQAQLLPLSKLKDADSLKSIVGRLSKDQVYYCHCRSGQRVLVAAKLLGEQGIDIRPLKQGYKALLQAGFPKAQD